MSETTDSDMQSLLAELRNLRSDFAKVGDILKETARHRSADAAEKTRETAERGWSEAKSTAKTVIEEMEERPVGTAMVVFVAGMLFGILLGGRR